MAVNKPYGDGRRIGAVKNRTQVLNPQTGIWTKRDPDTGRFYGWQKGWHTIQRGRKREVTPICHSKTQ